MNKEEIVLLSEIESLERLLYRLPENHPKRPFLQVELYKTAAGIRGEERLARKLVEFHLDEPYRYLRNICLSFGEWKVQMDGLLLTQRGAIIIESKNISGQLHFDNSTGEFWRTDSEGVRTVMEDPVSQLNKHIRFLDKFFKQHKIDLPIKGIVVFTSKQCEFMSKPATHHVCKTYQLVDHLFALLHSFPPKTANHNLTKIDKLLRKFHTPYKRQPLCQLYLINLDELQTGILCATCKKHTIIRKPKVGWKCEKCETVDRFAFQHAVQEYFSVIHTQLGNRQLRQFCKLDSPYTASRLLAALDLENTGSLRNRTYHLKKH